MQTDVAVEFETVDHVAVVTLNRPSVRNAVNGEVAAGLEASVDRIEIDDNLWVGVLAAKGPVFCVGADLRLLATGAGGEMYTERGSFAGITERVRTKPLIAAVDGPALAGGFEICLACDLIVASSGASFGLPEVKRSIIAAAGGLVRLPELLPRNVAMEMVLTGNAVAASRAFEMGLVNKLTEPGAARDEAIALAHEIAQNAPIATRFSRRVLLESAAGRSEVAWQLSRALLREISQTEDYKEGPRAFLEKRPPQWTAR